MKNKKLSKKIMLTMMIVLGISLVTAVGYYAIFSTSFTVLPSITVEGNLEQSLGDVYDGEMVLGEPVTLTNAASSPRTISLTEESECNVETTYVSDLELNKKDTEWNILPDTAITLSYTVVGNDFMYVVDTELVNYVVVYYPDLDGNPGSWNIDNAELVGEANTEWTTSIIGNLPNSEDWNDKAKLWVIPRADWEAQAWNPTEWYFENELVTFGSELTIDSESSITISPLYEVGVGEAGECTVTTTVA